MQRAVDWVDGILRGKPEDSIKYRRSGDRNPNAKLTDAQTEEIRRRWANGGITQQQLADEFGVSQPQISRLVK